LLVALFAALYIPESARHLIAQRGSKERLQQILGRISPDIVLQPNATFYVASVSSQQKSPVHKLFTEGRAAYTTLIWTTTFTLLIATYFVFSWLPTLFAAAGFSIRDSVLASTAFSVGSALGSLVLARILKFRWAPLGLAANCAIYAVALVTLGWTIHSYPLLVVVVFVAGIGCGTQAVLHAINVAVYPAEVRSTGVGWSAGVGRLGSVFGPLLGALLVGWQWDLIQILCTAAVPCTISAIALASLYVLPGTRRTLSTAFGHQMSVSTAKRAIDQSTQGQQS
jgi:AAHS family 4-hydroxybenzoate transporter-like MFS transporter